VFLIRIGAIDGYQRLVTSLGGNPVHLLGEVGFSPAQLRNPNTYVSYTRLAELLEITADACGEPMFGLLLSRDQTTSVLGDIAMTILQQPTVREALESIDRYLYLHARGARVAWRARGESVEVGLSFDITSPLGLAQLRQLSVGQLEKFLVELLSIREPVRSFTPLLQQRSCAPELTRLDSRLLSRIRFEAAVDGVRFPKRWLERQSHFNPETVRKHFQEYMQTLQQRYPDNLQDQIRDILAQLLPSGECSIERVAAALDLSPRVLQKRLKNEQTSYSSLLRQTRRVIAEQHLQHRTMSITDLALYLGYADVSVFSRHFRSWTGVSPRQWRPERVGN
jgi:AraC-like DNA-binding protein